jgi:hypothetical protein
MCCEELGVLMAAYVGRGSRPKKAPRATAATGSER